VLYYMESELSQTMLGHLRSKDSIKRAGWLAKIVSGLLEVAKWAAVICRTEICLELHRI
jgi:hypothetical protein